MLLGAHTFDFTSVKDDPCATLTSSKVKKFVNIAEIRLIILIDMSKMILFSTDC